MFNKIVITGPESTGKSTLTEALAMHFKTSWVKEYAREYLSELNRPYTFEEVINMAKMQLLSEKKISYKPSRFIFFDTDLTVYKIWIEEKYHTEVDWINQELKNTKDKLYLLCNIDLPWYPDPLREHPNITDRQRIFSKYITLLNEYQLNFHIISGKEDERLKKSIQIISNQK